MMEASWVKESSRGPSSAFETRIRCHATRGASGNPHQMRNSSTGCPCFQGAKSYPSGRGGSSSSELPSAALPRPAPPRPAPRGRSLLRLPVSPPLPPPPLPARSPPRPTPLPPRSPWRSLPPPSPPPVCVAGKACGIGHTSGRAAESLRKRPGSSTARESHSPTNKNSRAGAKKVARC